MDILVLQLHIVSNLQSLRIPPFLVKLPPHSFLHFFHCLCCLFPTLLYSNKEFSYSWNFYLNYKVTFPQVPSKVQLKWCSFSYCMFFVIVLKFCCSQPVHPIVLLVVYIVSQKRSYLLVYSFYLTICLRMVCCQQLSLCSQCFCKLFHKL